MRITENRSRTTENYIKTIRFYLFNGPQPNDVHTCKIILLILMILISHSVKTTDVDHITVLADSNKGIILKRNIQVYDISSFYRLKIGYGNHKLSKFTYPINPFGFSTTSLNRTDQCTLLGRNLSSSF